MGDIGRTSRVADNPPDDPWPVDHAFNTKAYEPWTTQKAYEHSLVCGSKGRILCPVSMLPPESPELVIEMENGKRTVETFKPVNQWTLEFEHLSRCIVEGTTPDYGMEDALHQQKAIDAVYRSIHSGKIESV